MKIFHLSFFICSFLSLLHAAIRELVLYKNKAFRKKNASRRTPSRYNNFQTRECASFAERFFRGDISYSDSVIKTIELKIASSIYFLYRFVYFFVQIAEAVALFFVLTPQSYWKKTATSNSNAAALKIIFKNINDGTDEVQ